MKLLWLFLGVVSLNLSGMCLANSNWQINLLFILFSVFGGMLFGKHNTLLVEEEINKYKNR